MVIFPGQYKKLALARRRSIAAADFAQNTDNKILLVPQYNFDAKPTRAPEYHNVGVVASIFEIVNEEGVTSLYVNGIKRVNIEQVITGEDFDEGIYSDLIETDDNTIESGVYFNKIIETLADKERLEDTIFSEHNIDIPEHITKNDLVDVLGGFMPYEIALELLSETNTLKRLETVLIQINREIEIAKINRRIAMKIRASFENGQKETYLREKMNVIQKELGIFDDGQDIRQKIEALNIDEESRQKLLKDLERSQRMQPSSSEYTLLRNYLDFVLELPWGIYTKDNIDLKRAKEILDREHHGLEKIKDRILEFLAVHALTNDHKQPILCFVGPPGVGKTTIVRSIADALGRNYVRMSLGGVHDEAEIRGHRKTYIGAMAGRIISSIKQAGSMNPVFLLDEVDKLTKDYRGDPSAALLEVLDPEFNHTFRDNYLEIPFDLKNVIFITTANAMDTIPPALLDRMEVIEMSGYTPIEKLEIAKRHLVTKQMYLNGLKDGQIEIGDDVIKIIIEKYTREAGVRQLEKIIAKIMRITARRIVEEEIEKMVVTADNISDFLGIPMVRGTSKFDHDEVGAATGLAWTQFGGDILNIEVSVMEGKGDILLTGRLGDVLKESGRAAISYLHSHAKELGIDESLFKTKDIHIHIPEGATPKDGPSAGVTLATAVYSALTKKPVRHDISMTGEITLRGKVLPIGGLKEKLMASQRSGIFEVIVPEQNKKDLSEVPQSVLDEIKINFVRDMDEVLRMAIR